jgi:hypothetical protein
MWRRRRSVRGGSIRSGWCDLLVKYGANQPLYDLMITRCGKAIHVSVKGSQDGGSGLNQNFKRGRLYNEAADVWPLLIRTKTSFIVSYSSGRRVGRMSACLLVTVMDIAERLKASRNGLGNTVLWENHCYKMGLAKGCTDKLPDEWRFSLKRLNQFLPESSIRNYAYEDQTRPNDTSDNDRRLRFERERSTARTH